MGNEQSQLWPVGQRAVGRDPPGTPGDASQPDPAAALPYFHHPAGCTHRQGQAALVLYEPSWGYVKLWQQLKDFRDWRVMEDKATLDVYNLTPQTNIVTLLIRGMAVNGSKRVRFGMLSQADFQNLQLAEWRVERVLLKPGLNQFILTDALWSVAKIPLLVDQVEVLAEEVRDQRSEISRR